MITSPPSSYALLPFIALAKDKAESYLPDSFGAASIILESTAVMQMTTTLCKNIFCVTRSNELKQSDLYNFLRSRIDYLALSLLCTANLIHNAMMAVIYGSLAIASKDMRYAFNKHWQHSLHCALGMGIGLCGIVSPALSAFLTSFILQELNSHLLAAWKRDFACFEMSLLDETKQVLTRIKMRSPNLFPPPYKMNTSMVAYTLFSKNLIEICLRFNNFQSSSS